MGKKMKNKILALLITVAVLLTAALSPIPSTANEKTEADCISGEVIAPARSLTEAIEISKAYGLELKSYAYEIAVFIADNPEQSIKQSKTITTAAATARVVQSNGKLPTLHRNFTYETSEYKSVPVYWQASNSQWHHSEMDNARAWERSTGAGVTVAVIDTGIDVEHPMLKEQILLNSYNSQTDEIGIQYVNDDHGHGTHVGGIIAASNKTGTSFSGVAPDSKLLVIKANEPGTGAFELVSLLRGINYAVENGADIINLSLGRSFDGGEDELEHATIQNAVNKGVTVICSAGNDKNDNASYPAAYPESIAVSATMQGRKFDNSYSNKGSQIDIAAPGTNILSAEPGGNSGKRSGTSMAAPNVAGKAALIKSINPDYNAGQLREALLLTAADAGDAGRDDYYGYGIANSYAGVLGTDALCKVTYNFNYGGRTPVSVYVIPQNTLFEPYEPLRTEYVTTGWYNNGSLFGFNTKITDDITLYAEWVQLSDGMYAAEFPDINFRRAVLWQINELYSGKRTSKDMVSQDEAMLAKVTELNIRGMDISDVAGIEHFTGLLRLSANYNRLSVIDVSALTDLEFMSLSGNQLSELDIAGCDKLHFLDVSFNYFESEQSIIGLETIKDRLTLIFYPQKNMFPVCGKCEICEHWEHPALGYVRGEPITIFDALEILKDIVGMNGAISKCGNSLWASLITLESQKAGRPSIFDVLEILKYLVGMDTDWH
ncbi:MAG: S8 family serine peptidase [Oscillospiraceae bacterium]|nr:S8 family serine peptidase [Oscillospiraceae bacterium]